MDGREGVLFPNAGKNWNATACQQFLLMQVRQGDQPWYSEDTIESFVGHSSMGFLCPPAGKNKWHSPERFTSLWNRVWLTHTHTYIFRVNFVCVCVCNRNMYKYIPGAPLWPLFLKGPNHPKKTSRKLQPRGPIYWIPGIWISSQLPKDRPSG